MKLKVQSSPSVRYSWHSVRAALLVGLLATVSACHQAPAQAPAEAQKPNAGLQPEYDKTGRLTKLAYDRNGDGKMETWGYMDGARVVRVEVDENADGAVDRWEYHSENAPTPLENAGADQTIERIERATRFDGKVSRRERFERGQLVSVEEDTDGNGSIDKWETYANGTLTLMALDTSGRGKPDRRLVYRDGNFDHIEADPTGSGEFKAVAQ